MVNLIPKNDATRHRNIEKGCASQVKIYDLSSRRMRIIR